MGGQHFCADSQERLDEAMRAWQANEPVLNWMARTKTGTTNGRIVAIDMTPPVKVQLEGFPGWFHWSTLEYCE